VFVAFSNERFKKQPSSQFGNFLWFSATVDPIFTAQLLQLLGFLNLVAKFRFARTTAAEA